MSAPASAGVRQRPIRAAPVGLVAAVLMGALVSTDRWSALEQQVEAALLARRGPLPWNDQVLVIDYDQASQVGLGRPLAREKVARVVNALTSAGVKSIAFDIVWNAPAFHGPADEAAFEAAIARNGHTVLAIDCLPHQLTGDVLPLGQFLPIGPTPAGGECGAIALPLPTLRTRATLAHFQSPTSISGLARYAAPLVTFGEGRFPTLALAAFLRGQGLGLDAIVQEPGGVRAGGLAIPVDAQGRVPVSLRGLPDEGCLSLLELYEALQGEVFTDEMAARVRGRYVLVGTSIDSLGDLTALADGVVKPAVAHHAAFLSDLLEHRVVSEVSTRLQIAAAVLAALLLTGAALLLQLWRGAIALTALTFAALGGSTWLSMKGITFGPLGTVVAGMVAWSATTAVRLAMREREQRVLRDAFGAYVDPTVLDRLLADPERYLALSGARKTLTVLFTDICGFTALTNRLAAEQVVSLLRLYLAEMSRIITAHGGRVDKIMGDGILAVFGDPIAREDHAARALAVCVEMQQAVRRLGTAWTTAGVPPLAIRLGVATGEVFVGNVGARESKLEYTVLGATVNLASRLEGHAPPGAVLVSDGTRLAGASGFEFAAVGTLKFKGFPERQPAWLLMGPLAVAGSPRRHARVEAPRVAVMLEGTAGGAPGWVINVSANGVFVETSLEAEVGAWLKLRFGGEAGVVVSAEVRRKAPGGLGLEITSEHAEASHLLAALRVGE